MCCVLWDAAAFEEARLAQIEPAEVGLGADDQRVGHEPLSQFTLAVAARLARPSRRRSCSSVSSAVRCRVSTPSACFGPCSMAISTLSISSSRGGGSSTGTASHQAPSSSRPAAVIS